MKIMFDIGHPAHVHYFKNLIKIMKAKGDDVLIIARNRECIFELLQYEGLSYVNRGTGSSTLLGKLIYAFKAYFIIFYHALKFRPNLCISHGSHYLTHVGWVLRKITIATGDSDHIKINAKILMPFLDWLITPSVYRLNYGSKHIFYNGYSELSYLHPELFSVDQSVIARLKSDINTNYFILRLVSWNAFHDGKQSGLSRKTTMNLIEMLSKHGRVFISYERELPPLLASYKTDFNSNELHHALAGAKLYIGEGATTAAEAALLGTPSVYINSLSVGYLLDLESEYGLCYNFRNEEGLLHKIETLLNDPSLGERHKIGRKKMLEEKINVTEFWLDFIEQFRLKISNKGI